MSPSEPLPAIATARRGDPEPGADPRLGRIAALLALAAVLIALALAGGTGLVHGLDVLAAGSGRGLLLAAVILGGALGIAAIATGALALLRHERPMLATWGIVLGLLGPVIAGAALALGIAAGHLVLS